MSCEPISCSKILHISEELRQNRCNFIKYVYEVSCHVAVLLSFLFEFRFNVNLSSTTLVLRVRADSFAMAVSRTSGSCFNGKLGLDWCDIL